MRLRYLTVNAAFVFTDDEGGDIIPMGDVRFFQTRADAVNAAAERGLRVTSSGAVEVIPRRRCAVGSGAPDLKARGSATCATVGCKAIATGVVTYGPDRDPMTDRVCTECGEGYARRPALAATFTED
jgi:hypothetical protein